MRYGPTAAGLCPNRDQETIPGPADRNNFLSPRRATPDRARRFAGTDAADKRSHPLRP
jgi:hypothetical protein